MRQNGGRYCLASSAREQVQPMNVGPYDRRVDLARWLTSMEEEFAQFEESMRQLGGDDDERRDGKCDRLALAWLCQGLAVARAAEHISREDVRAITDALADSA